MDLERYGDYNEYEFDAPKKKGIAGLVLKILIAVVCFGVIGVLLFRVFVFNHYPDSVKKFFFTDNLSSYYSESDGNFNVETQSLRFPYDDADKGRFFCDYLYVVRDAGSLQVTLRYNDSLASVIKEELGISIDLSSPDAFTFRLARNPGDGAEAESVVIGELDRALYDSFMMYNYYKLVFSDIDFTDVEWIRLEILVNGVEMKSPYKLLVYENNKDYSTFERYELSSEEKPE